MNPENIATMATAAMNNPAMIGDLLKNFLPSGLTGAAPLDPGVVSSLQELSSKANVEETMGSVMYFLQIKNVIAVALILWAVGIVLTRFFVRDETLKKDISYIHDVLFGGFGILPIVGSVWVLGLLLVTLLPSVVSVLPKFGRLITAITDAVLASVTM